MINAYILGSSVTSVVTKEMTAVIPSNSIPLTVMGKGSSFPQTSGVGKFYVGNVKDDKFTGNEIITYENTEGKTGGNQWFGWRNGLFSRQKLRITFWIKFVDRVPKQSSNFGIKVYGALSNDFVKQCKPNKWCFVEKTTVCPASGDGNHVLLIFDSINHKQTVRISQAQIQILGNILITIVQNTQTIVPPFKSLSVTGKYYIRQHSSNWDLFVSKFKIFQSCQIWHVIPFSWIKFNIFTLLCYLAILQYRMDAIHWKWSVQI